MKLFSFQANVREFKQQIEQELVGTPKLVHFVNKKEEWSAFRPNVSKNL